MTQNGKDRLWTGQYALVLIANLAMYLVHFVLLISIPLYLRDKGAGSGAAGLSTGLYSIMALVLRPLIGNFLDRSGRLRLLRIGLIPFLAGVVISNFTDSVTLQLSIRVIEGIGFSIISTTGATIVSDLVPRSRMTEGLGYNGMVVTLMNSIGPLIGLSIINSLGFDALFIFLIPMSILPMILTLFLKESGEEATRSGKKFDWKHLVSIEPGAIPASLMMVLASVSYGAIVTFLAGFGMERGVGNLQIFFLLFPLAVILSRLVTGRMIDRYGFVPIVIPCLVLAVLSLFLVFAAHSAAAFSAAAVMYGMGYGSLLPAFTALAIQNSPAERRGAANATFYISMDLGIGGGAMVLGYIGGISGTASIFLISAILMLLSLILFPLLGRKLQKRIPDVPF